VRLAEEPEGVLRLTVRAGSRADGQTVDEMADAATDSGDSGDVWVNMVVRGGALVSVRGDTVLMAGDEVLVSVDEQWHPRLEDMFRT
jgi:Trk K+ transport system NAD-binding subunit